MRAAQRSHCRCPTGPGGACPSDERLAQRVGAAAQAVSQCDSPCLRDFSGGHELSAQLSSRWHARVGTSCNHSFAALEIVLCSCVIGTHLTGQTLLQLFSFRASVVIHCNPSASAFPPCMATYCVSNQLRGDCHTAPRKVAHTCIVDWMQRVLHNLRHSRQAWAQHVRWVLRAELPGRGGALLGLTGC